MSLCKHSRDGEWGCQGRVGVCLAISSHGQVWSSCQARQNYHHVRSFKMAYESSHSLPAIFRIGSAPGCAPICRICGFSYSGPHNPSAFAGSFRGDTWCDCNITNDPRVLCLMRSFCLLQDWFLNECRTNQQQEHGQSPPRMTNAQHWWWDRVNFARQNCENSLNVLAGHLKAWMEKGLSHGTITLECKEVLTNNGFRTRWPSPRDQGVESLHSRLLQQYNPLLLQCPHSLGRLDCLRPNRSTVWARMASHLCPAEVPAGN